VRRGGRQATPTHFSPLDGCSLDPICNSGPHLIRIISKKTLGSYSGVSLTSKRNSYAHYYTDLHNCTQSQPALRQPTSANCALNASELRLRTVRIATVLLSPTSKRSFLLHESAPALPQLHLHLDSASPTSQKAEYHALSTSNLDTHTPTRPK